MSKAPKIPVSNSTEGSDDNRIKDIIAAYENVLLGQAKNVEGAKMMLELGAKTALIHDIEQFYVNPIQSLIDVRQKVDESLSNIADSFTVHFIKTCIKKETIKSAFKKIKVSDSLYYGIILMEDTFENREKILEYLNFYSTLNLSDKIPVYFQFVTEELQSSFKNIELIA